MGAKAGGSAKLKTGTGSAVRPAKGASAEAVAPKDVAVAPVKATRTAKSLAGKRLGRYTLLEHLASGGMAEIFLARHEAPGGFVKDLVLKVLQERFADNAEVVAMFLEEARLGAELRHPSIVDVYDAGFEDGLRFIAMEFIAGKTLTDFVLRAMEVAQPLPLPYAAFMIGQAAEALAYLQEVGTEEQGRLDIVHRDISPMNLVVSYTGQTKIIDFGIARRGTGNPEAPGARPGKLSYMSPEQVQGLPLDGRSDIFSLGTILYEITVGQRLWRGPAPTAMQRIVEEKPTPPTYIKRDFPPALELIILRALEKRPDDRYQSAADMAEDLAAYVAGSNERVGNRQIALFLQEIFSPSTEISEQGARRARAFVDEEDNVADELDFDRARPAAAGAAMAAALRGADPLATLPSSLSGTVESPRAERVAAPAPPVRPESPVASGAATLAPVPLRPAAVDAGTISPRKAAEADAVRPVRIPWPLLTLVFALLSVASALAFFLKGR